MLFVFISHTSGSELLFDFQDLTNTMKPLQISTYDGSGQLTHPDVIYTENEWNNYRYWLVFTPYPNGNNKMENPSLRSSTDGIRWVKPFPDLPDPVVPPPADVIAGGFNSDPDIVLAGSKMYLFYRQTSATRITMVYFKTSLDAVHWSESEKTDLPTTTTSPAFLFDRDPFSLLVC